MNDNGHEEARRSAESEAQIAFREFRAASKLLDEQGAAIQLRLKQTTTELMETNQALLKDVKDSKSPKDMNDGMNKLATFLNAHEDQMSHVKADLEAKRTNIGELELQLFHVVREILANDAHAGQAVDHDGSEESNHIAILVAADCVGLNGCTERMKSDLLAAKVEYNSAREHALTVLELFRTSTDEFRAQLDMGTCRDCRGRLSK